VSGEQENSKEPLYHGTETTVGLDPDEHTSPLSHATHPFDVSSSGLQGKKKLQRHTTHTEAELFSTEKSEELSAWQTIRRPGASAFSALPDGLAPRRTVVPAQPLAWRALYNSSR
jgi:hypothetical protein